ncbi:MAG: hypothetical protein HC811_03495, partial [Flammeovirgaceae bacterium]|nr:hypothetical protein [Flammeovirgaceae bacterium]
DFWQARSDPDREYGGHAVTVVGYNDSKFGGAFEIVNSWGKNWATEGFTWLRYDDMEKFALYGFELLPGPGNEISGSIFLATDKGASMQVTAKGSGIYMFNNPYPTGTKFNAEIELSEPNYFYCLAFDENFDFVQLFPSDKSLHPWLSAEFLKFPLRSPDQIELFDPPGKNYLCLIVSGSALDIQKQGGLIRSGKMNYIRDINSISAYNWSGNQLVFSGPFHKDSIIILMVELDQIAK